MDPTSTAAEEPSTPVEVTPQLEEKAQSKGDTVEDVETNKPDEATTSTKSPSPTLNEVPSLGETTTNSEPAVEENNGETKPQDPEMKENSDEPPPNEDDKDQATSDNAEGSMEIPVENATDSVEVQDDDESPSGTSPKVDLANDTSTETPVLDEAVIEDAHIPEISLDMPPSNTQAEEDARLQAEEDKRHKAEEEARLQADHEEDRLVEEATVMQQAEEDAHVKADQELARLEAESQTQQMAEEEARIMADQEEDRLVREGEAQKMAEEEARMLAGQLEEEKPPENQPLPTPSASEANSTVEKAEDSSSASPPNGPTGIAPEQAALNEQESPEETTDAPNTASAEEEEESARLHAEDDKRQQAEREARVIADKEENKLIEEDFAMKQVKEDVHAKADQETVHVEAETNAEKMAEEEARMKYNQEEDRLEVQGEAEKPTEEEEHVLADQIENEPTQSNLPTISDSEEPDKSSDSPIAEIPTKQSEEEGSTDPVEASDLMDFQTPAVSTMKDEDDDIKQPQGSLEKLDSFAREVQEEVTNLCSLAFPVDSNEGEIPDADTPKSTVDPANMTVSFMPALADEPDLQTPSGHLERVSFTSAFDPVIETKSSPSGIDLTKTFGDETPEQKSDTPSSKKSRVSFAGAFGGDTPKSKATTPSSQGSGMSFAQAFGDDTPKSAVSTPSSSKSGHSFADAFGDDTPKSKVVATSPSDTSTGSSIKPSPLKIDSENKGDTSLTAFGAAKNRRVSGLMSKYLDKVTKEPLPGDSIKLESVTKSIPISPLPSPVKPSSTKSIQLDKKDMAKIGSIRQKFETSAKKSKSNVFEFGEAFRQKQRFSLLAERERKKEAIVNIHGFDEMIVGDRTKGGGEVDTSNLNKSFAFELAQGEDGIDGKCKVDYQNADYHGMVFVVHKTRGMLLLNHYSSQEDRDEIRIPGGKVLEKEFLKAAKKSGYAGMQLQLAARRAAARSLYEGTGIDIRKAQDRLTPAVLRMPTKADAAATQYLKNENENRLYYFLQVSEEDFVRASQDGTGRLLEPKGEDGTGLLLKLSNGFSDFTFIRDPADATAEFGDHGDSGAMKALSMIMSQSANHDDPAKATTYVRKDENNKLSKEGQLSGADNETDWEGTVIAVEGSDQPENEEQKEARAMLDMTPRTDKEADLTEKPSMDSTTAQQEVVTCCCGFWR